MANLDIKTIDGLPALDRPLIGADLVPVDQSDGAGGFDTRKATADEVQTFVTGGGSGFAPLDSPDFTGIPTAPTADVSVNNTQIATTAYVHTLAAGMITGVSSFNSRTGAVSPATDDYTWAQINKATSSLADITTRNYSDLQGLPSLFSGAYADLSGKPTTLSGYGITDAVPNTRTVNGHALNANVTVTPGDLGLVIGTNVEAWDADLDAIAALSPSNDDIIQRKAGAWVNRTVAQYKSDLSLATVATSGSASDLGTGTLPDGRLSANVVLIDGSRSFTSPVSGVSPTLDAHLATKAYADSLVVGLLDDRGNYNAGGNLFPSAGGSGTAGAILKGDIWTISVAGTLGGHPVTAGDVVRALTDAPGQTDANWAISENNFGFTPLNASLNDGQIYIGNSSNIGTARTLSGNVTVSNTGVTTIGAAQVTNAMLAGSISNANLANSSVTIGSTSVSLGGTAATIAGLTLTSPTFTGPALGTPVSGVATNLTGTAASLTAGQATVLATARAINGVNFDGSAPITVTAAASTLTGTTLNATVVTSSLTSHGVVTSGTLGAGAVLAGVTMTLGSDADGDIYYRASNVLTRLPKGSALFGLRMNAGATAPEWAAISATLTVGTSAIGSGTGGRFLYETTGNVLGEISTLTSDGTIVTFSPTVTTGSGATAGLNANANSLTTGTAFNFASSSVTSGTIFNIASTSTAAASSTLTALSIAVSGANGTTAQTVTGAKISVTNTNITSGTNVGLSVTASGATTNNISILATGMVAFSGTTNSFPALFRSAASLQVVLADQSNFADFKAGNVDANGNFRGTSTSQLVFNSDTIIRRAGVAASLALGVTAVDLSSAVVAQTLTVQGLLVGGTSNQAGKDFTIDCSQSKGSGAGGGFIVRVTPAGSTGTALNAYTTAMTLAADLTLTLADTFNFVLNATTGTKIATATSQKLGFWNATPIIQPAAAGQAALTNSTGGTGDGTLEDVTTSTLADPAKCNNNFTELFTLTNAIRTALVNSGIMKGAA